SVAVGPGGSSASGTATPVSANRDINPAPGGAKNAIGLSGMTSMGIGKSGAGSGGPGGIEGFLRRGAAGGTEARGLSDLVGKEEIFVEIHAGFVGILAGLGRRFGFEGGWGLGDWGGAPVVSGGVAAGAKA